MKFWAKIKNSALKGIILLNIQTLLKKFPINSEARKIYIETQEHKLKQQRTFLKCLMTENQCITFASYKISMHFENFTKCEMPNNFRIEFYLSIIDSLIDDFTSRFDKESMQLFHLASQFI